jgi:hypothetical protein
MGRGYVASERLRNTGLAHLRRFNHTAVQLGYMKNLWGYLNYSFVAFLQLWSVLFSIQKVQYAEVNIFTGNGLKRSCRKPKPVYFNEISPCTLLLLYVLYHIQRCGGEWRRQEWSLNFKAMRVLDMSTFKGTSTHSQQCIMWYNERCVESGHTKLYTCEKCIWSEQPFHNSKSPAILQKISICKVFES